MKKGIAIVVALALISGAAFLFLRDGKERKSAYRTERVGRGDIQAVVTATGTVNAVTMVLVGTQVSGTIKGIFVDYNSPVAPGQLLAQIDPAAFEAQVDQAQANLRAAEANVMRGKAALDDAQRTLERNRQLFAREFIARSELDSAETAFRTAEAQLAAYRAQAEQSGAALRLAETNLRYTRILSPVHGIVISRNVDVGQTVAASFQTPTLFSIARDLTRMQVDASVDEADIGRIRVGLPVEFTVDAYPDRPFRGRVSEIRNAPVTVQNVVTYDTVVLVRNPELKLKPGMTANVSIVLEKRTQALRVPNAAFRVKMPAGPQEGERGGAKRKVPGVWVLRQGKPVWVNVTPGITDGHHTEIVAAELGEGDAVITDAAAGAGNAARSAPGFGPGFIR